MAGWVYTAISSTNILDKIVLFFFFTGMFDISKDGKQIFMNICISSLVKWFQIFHVYRRILLKMLES